MTPPLTPSPRSDFALNGSIGTGHSNKGDVLKLRRALQKTGHGRFPRNPATNVTPGLMDAIEGFQRDFSLKPDGMIAPGGPTEGALRIALTAIDADGQRGLETVRSHFQDRARAGLTYRPDPNDPIGARWRAPSGALLSDDQAAREAGPGAGETRTAMMMRRRDGILGRSSRPLEGGPGGFSRGSIGAGVTLRAIMNQMLREAAGEVSRHPAPGDDGGSRRTVPVENMPRGTPPFPDKPPEGLDFKEEIIPEERRPTILVNPITEEGGPQIEVYPDMSDILEKWIILENSRGTKDGQQKDLQYIIDALYAAYERKGIVFDHTHGGRRGKTAPDGTAGQYLKEKVFQRKQRQNKGSRRSDLRIKLPQLGVSDDFNVVDTLVDRKTPTARERRAFNAIVELKDGAGDMFTIGKSKGMDWEEWTKEIDRWVDEYTDAKLERIRAKG